MKQIKQQGFTLIELIVVMAIIAILVLIAAPKFIGYTEKAKLTQVINDIKVSEKAAEQYYLQHDLWPRDQLATAYTDEQLTLWVDDFRNLSGETVTLEDGDYYDVDWQLMKPFMSKPENDFKYIIQNPVGDIYYVNDLTPAGEQTKFAGDNQTTTEPQPTTEANVAPVATITMTPETNLFTSTNITWSTSNSTDPNGDLISNVEWEGKQDIYTTAGSYTVKLRVKDEHGLWSEWIEKTFYVLDASGIKQVFAGEQHAIALMNDGTLLTWGKNNFGQLGDGTTIDRIIPVYVKNINGISNLEGVANISIGGSHTIALMSDGTALTWGYNYYGQLGDNTKTNRTLPTYVKNINNTGNLMGIKDISAGYGHTLIQMNDNSILSWGFNDFGQLGDGTTISRSLPNYVKNNANSSNLTNVRKIIAGQNHNVAIMEDETAMAWGINLNGRLGDNTTTNRILPIFVKNNNGTSNLNNIKDMSASSSTFAILKDGTVMAWGYNAFGSLGDNTTIEKLLPVFVRNSANTGNLINVKKIYAQNQNTVALMNDGTVMNWGRNWAGQLGDNSIVDKKIPVFVKNSTNTGYLTGVNSVTAGNAFTIVLKDDGTAMSWGRNDVGQLADNTRIDKKLPVFVKNSTGLGYLGQ